MFILFSFATANHTQIFEKFRESVEIIDEDYKKKWGVTKSNQKLEYYKAHDLEDIFSMLPYPCGNFVMALARPQPGKTGSQLGYRGRTKPPKPKGGSTGGVLV